MLRVVVLVHERASIGQDGLVAIVARGGELCGVVRFAIRFSILFEEGSAIEYFSTSEAAEVLRMPHATNSRHSTTKDRLAALETSFLQKLLVVLCAVECTFELVAIASNEGTATLFAAEVLSVHVLTLEDDKLTGDGPQTFRANLLSSAKDGDALHVAINAEHVLRDVLDLELLSSQFDTTGLAHEVFRVEKERFRRSNVLVSDGVSASLALVSKQLVEVGLTVWLLVLDHEFATDERLRTAGAHEVFRVVGLA